MQISFSWDDGAKEDLKLFELHNRFSIPGMFFVPNRNVEGRNVLSPIEISQNESDIIQFGGHTENHRYLDTVSADIARKEVLNNKLYLEEILGHEINHFCLPGGRINKTVLEIVKEYYRTIRTADTMCFTRTHDSIIRPSFHFYPRGLKSLLGNAFRHAAVPEMRIILGMWGINYFHAIKKILEYEASKVDARIMIWGHSWEIEEKQLWRELELFFEYIYDSYYDACVPYDSFC